VAVPDRGCFVTASGTHHAFNVFILEVCDEAFPRILVRALACLCKE